jgi:hypothetical protein
LALADKLAGPAEPRVGYLEEPLLARHEEPPPELPVRDAKTLGQHFLTSERAVGVAAKLDLFEETPHIGDGLSSRPKRHFKTANRRHAITPAFRPATLGKF